jgi:hypothetical protein
MYLQWVVNSSLKTEDQLILIKLKLKVLESDFVNIHMEKNSNDLKTTLQVEKKMMKLLIQAPCLILHALQDNYIHHLSHIRLAEKSVTKISNLQQWQGIHNKT